MVAQLDSKFLRVAPGRAVSRLVSYSLFEGRPATTSGRWWNPVVFGNLHMAARHEPGKPDRPIFIVGMGRSGTTLLGRILAAHRDVGFLNEPKAMWHVIRDDEDIIGSYAPAHTGRLYLDAEDADEQARRRGQAVFSWYLRASRSKRLLDKYPELIFRHRFVRSIFPDARFLIATRSPWSTLTSVAKWSESHATDNADWWGVGDQKWEILWTQGVIQRTANADLAALDLGGESDHHVRAAVEWIVTMREAISLAVLDPLAHLIDYEELVRHPRETIRKTMSFCELPSSLRTEDYATAIVSTQEREDDRDAASHFPAALAGAIEDTWSGLVKAASSLA